VVLFAAGGPAWAADWRLVEVSGEVRLARPGGTAAAPAANQIVPVGSNITTAQGGRAVLTNGDQRIVVGPNSRMTVAPETSTGMVRVMQDLGSILFQVDKKPAQHFRVETGLLAAVVKGTTFTVNVGPTGDSVHVAEGLVEVRPGGGAATDVTAGATGTVNRAQPDAVGVTRPSAEAPAAPAEAIPPLDYGQASGGLVESPGATQGAAAVGASSAFLNDAPQGAGGGETQGQGAQGLALAAARAAPAAFDNPAARPDSFGPGRSDGALARVPDGGPGSGNGDGPANVGNGNRDVPRLGNGNGNGNGGGGQGNGGNGGGNAGGNGNGNGNGSAGDQGQGNGNAGGNGNGIGNSGQGNGGGNAGGNGNGNGNGGGNAQNAGGGVVDEGGDASSGHGIGRGRSGRF
jgi:hypothetical protein